MSLYERLMRDAVSYDKINRMKTTVCPYNVVEPLIRRKAISERIRTGKDKAVCTLSGGDRRIQMLNELGAASLVTDENDRITFALAVAQHKFFREASYVSDMAAGLFTLITREYQKKNVEWIITQEFSTIILIDYRGLLKAVFGYAVNDNGHALHGFGDVVKEGKKIIDEMLRLRVMPPAVFSRIPCFDEYQNLTDFKVIAGHPVIIREVLYNRDGSIDKVAVELSHDFFPIACYGDRNRFVRKIDRQRYIHSVSALQTVLTIGRKIIAQKHEDSFPIGKIPSVTTAKKLILAEQAAYNLKNIVPELVSINSRGRTSIALQAGFIRENLTGCIRGDGSVSWKNVSETVAVIGQMYRAGLNALEIFNEIQYDENIIIPAMEKACEFRRETPKLMYVKLDKPNKVDRKNEFTG